MQKPTIHGSLLLWAVVIGAAQASPHLTDNFDSGSNGAASFNSTIAADQGGTLAGTSYSVYAPGADWQAQHGNDGAMLLVGEAGYGGRASLNQNFATLANAADLPVSFQMDAWVTDTTNNSCWASITIGSSQNLLANDLGAKFAILPELGGGLQVILNGSQQILATRSGNNFRIVLSDTTGTGSAFNGKGSRAVVYNGSNFVGTYTLSQLTAADGYLSFSACPYNGAWNITRIDNLSIRVENPATPLKWLLWTGNANWPADKRASIIAAMEEAVGLYNSNGYFPKNLVANYNAGVPTAQAGYGGWMDFGNSFGTRVTLHEIAHTLGCGTHWNWPYKQSGGQWTGAETIRYARLFDGPTAGIGCDAIHFWPYGLNYDNEDSATNRVRHVKIVAAMRRDMGIVGVNEDDGVFDDDLDGLPDDWEMFRFGNLNQSGSGDPDQDGRNNLAEYVGDTNPNVADFDFVWNNGTSTGNWNTTDANWTGATWSNGSGNNAIFNTSAGTITLTEAISAGNFTFGLTGANTAGTFDGAALTINGDLTAQASNTNGSGGPTLSFSNNVAVGGDVRINRRVLEITGGTLTANRVSTTDAWGRLLVSGGNVTITNGIDDSIFGVGTAMSVMLQGGTLSTPYIKTTTAGWTGLPDDGFVLDGGTLIPTANSTDFIQTWDPGGWGSRNDIGVGTGGANIDTNGFDITISKSLKDHGGAGSLTKSGSGTLTLSAESSYSGGTTVNGGTLQLDGASGGSSRIHGALTVNEGATVSFDDDGTGLGFNGGAKVDTLHINGGTVTSAGVIHVWNLPGGANLTGGTLQSNNGTSTTSGPQLEWNGSTLNSHASATPSVIAGRVRFRPESGTIHTFNVADGPAATDLLVSAALTESSRCGLVKTGSGTMSVTGSVILSGVITVEAGTLDLSSATLGPDLQINVSNNALLRLPASVANKVFISGKKLAAGTWGPPGSVVAGTATFESPVFSGGTVVSLTNTEPSARERWLNMHYGMLVHYSSEGAVTRNLDGSPAANLESLANSFDAQGFANDLQTMGVEYVIFTAWHSNFVPLFNSSAVVNNFGFQRNSSRDVIGDMVAAVKAKGIRVLLYANIGQASVFTDNRWNDVMEDIFAEMLDRYDIDGFFMDENDSGGNMSWDFPRIARTIYQRKPDAVTIQNFYGNLYTWEGAVGESGPATADLSNNIMWTGSSPYAQVISQTWGALVPKVPTPTFAATRSAEGIYRGTVVAAGSRTEGGGIMWSAGPFTGNGTWFNPSTNQTEFVGRWEAGVMEAMQGAGTYIAPVAEAIKGVRPSNSWRPQGWIGNLEWGVATRKPDDSREYIHVLNPPATKTLNLPAPNDGKLFANARLLPSNNPVTLVQTPRGVTLTLGASDNWNPLNTVIAMDVIAQGGRGLTNDDSNAVTYSGSSWTWQRNRGLGEYGDDAHVATANGDSFSFTFDGTDVELIASRGPTRGTVEVFIDEIPQGTANLNNASPVNRATVFSKSGLARGPHTLRVVKQSGTDFAVDAFQVTELINNTDPGLVFGALSNYNNTQTTPNGVGYVEYDANWIWQQRYWTEYNGDIHYAQWNGSEATIHFNGTGIVWEGNSQGIVDFYLDGIFVKQMNMGALNGSNQVGYEVSSLPPGNHTLRFVKVGGVYVEFDNFRVYNSVNDQWSASASTGSWNGDIQTTPNNDDFMLMSFTGHSADILTRQDSQGGTSQVTLDGIHNPVVNHYRSIPTSRAPVFSTLTSDLLAAGNHTLRMTKKRGQNMSADAVRIYKQFPSPDFRFWQGDTGSSFTTPANWLENEWAQWNVYVFDSNVVSGTASLDSFFGCGDLYLASGLNHEITINGPNPLVMAADQRAAWNIPNPTGTITIADESRNLTIHTSYLSSGPVRWDVGAGRTLALHAALQDWNGTASLVKQGAGTAVLSSTNTYTGHTTVLAGTLRLGNGSQNSSLADTADVIIASGATLDLNFSGTDTIHGLVVAGVPKPPGVYSSANSSFITGTGTLTVTTGPATDYENWATANNLSGNSQADDDHDGSSNVMEYAFGLDPKNGSSTSPYLTKLNAATGTITYSRRKTTLTALTYKIWTSTNLTTWTEDSGASQTATAIPGTDNESVEVTLTGFPSSEARLFLRVSAK